MLALHVDGVAVDDERRFERLAGSSTRHWRRRQVGARTGGSPNSSPPRRATVSPSRSAPTSRSATSLRSASPVVVAERVVDLLEVVEVHDEQTAPTRRPVCARDRLVDAVGEQDAVRETGELVVQRLMLEGSV